MDSLKKSAAVIKGVRHIGSRVLLVTLVWVAGCTKKRPPSVQKPGAPIALDTPVEFQIGQRSTVALPGSEGRVTITIDDITRGQVMTSLALRDGKVITAVRSLHENDRINFALEGYNYIITLKKLNNVLIGEDTASFELSPAGGGPSAETLSENDKIEKLMLSLRNIEGATFIRNGQAHTVDEAIAHLRAKWEWKKSEIKTAEDFITLIGSRSSTTGKPYLIKHSDGSEITSEQCFRRQLQIVENLTGKPETAR
jgi:hypothetical protein